jgi:hypothetical protein
MTLGLRRKAWLAASFTTALYAVGCSDDGSSGKAASDTDAGDDADAGSAGGATGDAAPLDTTSETDVCGACPNQTTGGSLTLKGCCIEESATCGLDVTPLGALVEGSGLSGCQPRDVAGVPSDYCSAFFDQIDGEADGRFALGTSLGTLKLAGCCTADGGCGLSLSSVTLDAGSDTTTFDLSLGCLGLTELSAALGESLPSVDSADLTLVPYCDGSTGQQPESGPIPGFPEFVCGCGSASAYDPAANLLPCFSYVRETVCGADAPDEATLGQVPVFLCGCGDDTLWDRSSYPCLDNVPADTCGTREVTEDDLGLVPVYVCGCGEGELSDGTCLSNVAVSTCGSAPFDGTQVIGVPAYVCGCGAGERGNGACIPNVPSEVCGTEPPTSATIEGVPEYVCGCGRGVRGTGSCIPNVDTSVCGADEVTSGGVPGVPEYVCGCGDGELGDGSCLANVPSEVCGELPFAADSVAGLPLTVCGCGDGVVFASGLRCLSNLPVDVCGESAAPIDDRGTPGDDSDDCIRGYSMSTFGCGEGTTAGYPASCVSNVAAGLAGCGPV